MLILQVVPTTSNRHSLHMGQWHRSCTPRKSQRAEENTGQVCIFLYIYWQCDAPLSSLDYRKDTANSTNTSTTHSSPTDDPSPCPFNHCVTWRTLIIDASNLTHPLTLENIGTVFPSLDRGPLKCTFFNASKLHGTPVYAVRMATEEQGQSPTQIQWNL